MILAVIKVSTQLGNLFGAQLLLVFNFTWSLFCLKIQNVLSAWSFYRNGVDLYLKFVCCIVWSVNKSVTVSCLNSDLINVLSDKLTRFLNGSNFLLRVDLSISLGNPSIDEIYRWNTWRYIDRERLLKQNI